MLTLQGVSVDYDGREVVHAVHWEVGGGSPVTALLGPSGCGKSTLLRAIAGLEPLTAGTIAFGGVDLADIPVHRRDFGIVFQDGQLFPGRTVGANIAYGLARRGFSRAERAERVGELLDLVQLPGMADRDVAELSGGQAQRVALARALAPRPRLLLLDEPLAALDQRLREELAVAIAEIVDTTATPTVVVTHDHGEAALMADTIAVMNDGQIVDEAPAQQLWHRPATEWVARFLGATTVVDGVVRGDVLTLPFAAPTPLSAAVHRGSGDAQWPIALRPESLVATPDPSGIGTVRAVRELVGVRRARIRLELADCGYDVDALAPARLDVGQRVSVTVTPDAIGVIGA